MACEAKSAGCEARDWEDGYGIACKGVSEGGNEATMCRAYRAVAEMSVTEIGGQVRRPIHRTLDAVCLALLPLRLLHGILREGSVFPA